MTNENIANRIKMLFTDIVKISIAGRVEKIEIKITEINK